MTTALIASISFGHSAEELGSALAPAVSLSAKNSRVRVICIDDSSGSQPEDIPGVIMATTIRRVGFAGAVNEIVDRFGRDVDRLVLINPDARITEATLDELLSCTESIAIPRVDDGFGRIENLRKVTTARYQLRALVMGEPRRTNLAFSTRDVIPVLDLPPYCPSGAVISIATSLLRSVRLHPDFFWLELSDWVSRLHRQGIIANLRVIDGAAIHTGASTSKKYPVSVAASQLCAKKAFIHEYGSKVHKLLLPMGILLRSARFGIKTRSVQNSLFLLGAAAGIVDWRVER